MSVSQVYGYYFNTTAIAGYIWLSFTKALVGHWLGWSRLRQLAWLPRHYWSLAATPAYYAITTGRLAWPWLTPVTWSWFISHWLRHQWLSLMKKKDSYHH